MVRTDSVDRENEEMNSVPYLSLSLSLEDAPLLDMSTDFSAGSGLCIVDENVNFNRNDQPKYEYTKILNHFGESNCINNTYSKRGKYIAVDIIYTYIRGEIQNNS